jgi:hypothetical protein
MSGREMRIWKSLISWRNARSGPCDERRWSTPTSIAVLGEDAPMLGPRVARRHPPVALVLVALACAAPLAACSSGSSSEEQRDEVVRATEALVEGLTHPLNLRDLDVLDDGTDPRACSGDGARYEYVTTARTTVWSEDPSPTNALRQLAVLVRGTAAELPDAGVLERAEEAELDERTRETVFSAGDDSGATVTARMAVEDGGSIVITLTGATACS